MVARERYPFARHWNAPARCWPACSNDASSRSSRKVWHVTVSSSTRSTPNNRKRLPSVTLRALPDRLSCVLYAGWLLAWQLGYEPNRCAQPESHGFGSRNSKPESRRAGGTQGGLAKSSRLSLSLDVNDNDVNKKKRLSLSLRGLVGCTRKVSFRSSLERASQVLASLFQ